MESGKSIVFHHASRGTETAQEKDQQSGRTLMADRPSLGISSTQETGQGFDREDKRKGRNKEGTWVPPETRGIRLTNGGRWRNAAEVTAATATDEHPGLEDGISKSSFGE